MSRRRSTRKRSGASPDEISACVDLILKAKRPVIFIGHGVTLSEASKELTEFAHRLQIPVISSPNGMGCLDMTDPLVARLHRPQRRLSGE